VNSVETNKHIFNFFSPSASHIIIFFRTQHQGDILTGTHGGVECRCSRQKSRFWANICLHRVLSTLRSPDVINTLPLDRGKLWHLPLVVSGGVCWWRETTTKSLWQEVWTEQHLIVRSDKSVANVTNNERLRSTFCTIEAKYWQTRSIARPLCDSRATCSNWTDIGGRSRSLAMACFVGL